MREPNASYAHHRSRAMNGTLYKKMCYDFLIHPLSVYCLPCPSLQACTLGLPACEPSTAKKPVARSHCQISSFQPRRLHYCPWTFVSLRRFVD